MYQKFSFYKPVPVAGYSRDDWQKLRAAVDALKKPVLDESIVLEGSPVGEHHLQQEYNRFHSTPNIPNTSEEEEAMRNSHFHYQSPIPALVAAEDQLRVRYGHQPELGTPSESRFRRASVDMVTLGNGGRDVVPVGSRQPRSQQDLVNGERSLTNQWILELPDHGRRSRSHTEPILPPESILKNEVKFKRSTLPHFTSPPPPADAPPLKPLQPPSPFNLSSARGEDGNKLVKPSPATGSSAREEPGSGAEGRGISRKTSETSGFSPHVEAGESRTVASPQGSLTAGSQQAFTPVKIYMTKVQKGESSSHMVVFR